VVLLVEWAVLYVFGAYGFVWRYVGMAEMAAFSRAGAASTLILLAMRLFLPTSMPALRVPLSIIIMNSVLAFGGVAGVRMLRRAMAESERSRKRRNGHGPSLRPAVLLIGAGSAGLMAVREIHSRGDLDLEVRGFVDDDPMKQGATISGVRVLGTTQDLPALVHDLGIDHVIITIPDAGPEAMRRILAICETVPVRARAIPALYDVLQGKVSISRFRDVRPEELLERDVVSFDDAALAVFLNGKVVLVTGAGGSIGSELARQAARFTPLRLLLLDRAEFALFEIDRELRERWPELTIVPLVADICDRGRMHDIFALHRPHVVTHAAAHKHVPLMEHNPGEAIKNNVFGTRTLGELAGEHGAEAFVMISTDKAVRPTSIMGASKRVAELVVQNLGDRYRTRYVAVRFGNVLGSAGSVIPIFREQIARGGPVRVTHPDMKRYFMTIPEATVLALEAGAMGQGGEIFVLDMGEPVRIVDLAKRLIELSGQEKIDILFTGVRPGEKLFEELETSDEAIAKTRHPKIFIGKITGRSTQDMERALARLQMLAEDARGEELRHFLAEFLPEAELAPRSPAVVHG
jgi:FlaA1/EpsC-like NDP-sugar epimerase